MTCLSPYKTTLGLVILDYEDSKDSVLHTCWTDFRVVRLLLCPSFASETAHSSSSTRWGHAGQGQISPMDISASNRKEY